MMIIIKRTLQEIFLEKEDLSNASMKKHSELFNWKIIVPVIWK
jgi:hypothetical protein